ncbi:hypothetical protein [Clostridium botulinum]|nr:hypothetical protein [Clostridium botulinum]AEB77645.1 hypothetical protein CbC4_7034 [Clostridium botulinum BKT015925]MCD3211063.1 hypothetical protein [Clostridium botulinum C/D]MCD3259829.1 hypothetical protein [Clostridium botulinum C/D]MCD3264975.1 hypothetical protein [Clostridium botulinum C/D]
MKILTDIMFILNVLLAMYYKFKKKDAGEVLWYLGIAIMMLVTHLIWRV